MLKNKKLEEYTEQEFLEVVRRLSSTAPLSEKQSDDLIHHIVLLSEHPAGTDVIFYPEPGIPDTPEGIVEVIKKWRAENGKPSFKPA
jgi:hypothetical protein